MIVAYSDGLECPRCHTLLEADSASRMPAIWIALLAAWLVWYITQNSVGTSTDTIAWVLPELYSILTFGLVSASVLMFTGRLVIAPTAPAIDLQVTTAAPGHGSGHSSGHYAGHTAHY
jgi:hypothetical protein